MHYTHTHSCLLLKQCWKGGGGGVQDEEMIKRLPGKKTGIVKAKNREIWEEVGSGSVADAVYIFGVLSPPCGHSQ